MASPETGKAAIAEILEDALQPLTLHKRNREALKRRREWRDAFLAKADELLAAYPQTVENSIERGMGRRTRPVDIQVGEQTLQVQVIETTTVSVAGHRTEKWVGLQITQPNGEQRILFGVEEITERYGKPVTSTIIRTARRGAVATNDHVFRGLQAINFLADQLANQPR